MALNTGKMSSIPQIQVRRIQGSTQTGLPDRFGVSIRCGSFMSDRKHLELGKDQFPRCVVTEKSRVPGRQKNVTTGTLVPFSTGDLEIDGLGCLMDKISELGVWYS